MIIILPFHIIIALSSLIYTGYLFISPSKNKIHIAYTLVTLTLVTGFYLVATKPSHMTQTCAVGLAYLAVIGYGIMAARYKLARNIIK